MGVVDVLPACLSSKYFFWDPDLAPLALGKVSAMKEIQWVAAASLHCPSLKHYYMGYYIHVWHIICCLVASFASTARSPLSSRYCCCFNSMVAGVHPNYRFIRNDGCDLLHDLQQPLDRSCDAKLRLGYQSRLGGYDCTSMCRHAQRCATKWTSSRQICCAPRAWSGSLSTAYRLPWMQTPGPSSQKSQQQPRALWTSPAPQSTAAGLMLRSAPAAVAVGKSQEPKRIG